MMKLKQFMFALVAMMLGFALPTSAQTSVSTLAELKGALANYVQLPAGMDASNYESLFGTNSVTDGTNYYATLQAAVEAVAGNANTVLYCKPGADVGALQHAPVTSTLTVYGNGANVTGGSERDFDLGNTDPSGGKDIAADMTLTVKHLNGCGAWGSKTTEHTVNLVFENCANMGKVFIYGTTGTLNLTMTDCAFEGVIKEAVYTNADGAITLTNVAFSNLNKAINLNHKAAGTQTVTINGCSFTACGNNVAADEIPVRVLSSAAGGKSVLTVNNTTFTGTPEGGADILLDYGVGVTEATVTKTAANVKPENKEGNAEMVAVTAATEYAYTNVLPVAQIGTTPYNTLAAAVAAAQNDATITLIADVKLSEMVTIPAGKTITLDLAGYKIVGGWNGNSTTNHIYALSNKGTLTINDSSEGNGSINSRGIYNYGSLTLNAGAINAIDGNGGYAVNNQSGSIFVMNGGVVAATNENDHQSSSGGYDATALKVPAGCTATLNGGTINNVCDFTYAIEAKGTLNIPETSTITVNGTHGAIAVSGGVTTIDAGTYTIPKDNYIRTDNVLYVSGGSLVVNGGTFIGDSDTASGGSCLSDAAGTAVVNGGTFKGSSGGDVWGTTGTTIKGGTFENLIEKQHIADGYEMNENGEVVEAVKEVKVATLAELQAALADNSNELPIIITAQIEIPAGETVTIDLNGKNVTVVYQEGSTTKHIYSLDNYGTLTIKDTKGNGSINSRGIFVQEGSKLTVENGSIYGIDSNGGSALYQFGGDIVIKGGHIEQKAEGTYNFAINALGGTVTVNGGKIAGNHGAIAAGGATVVINDGELVCTGTAGMTDNVLYTYDNGTITINGGTFVADNDGPAGGCCVYDANGKATINGGTFSNSSGGDVWGTTGTTIKGGTFENLIEKQHIADGYEMNENGEVVEAVKEVKVATLAELQAALADNSNELPIIITETIVIPEGETVVLDLNGKTVTRQDEATKYAINNLGTLTIQDTKGNGSINARGIYNGYGDGAANVATAKIIVLSGTINAKGTNGGAAIFNYGTANVNAGTFTSIGGYSLNNQPGSTMTIADGVSANNGVYNSNATLTINGGEISGNRSGCHVIYAWNSTLTINGGALHNNNAGNATILADGAANVTINGGTFSINNGQQTHGWTSCLLDANGGATYVIADGEFKGHFRVQANSSMEISGGTFEDTHNSGYAIYGTTVVKGGTFTDDTAKAFATKYVAEGYELNEGTVVKKTGLAGAGTEANPYLISSVEDLILFRNSVNAGKTTYNAEGVYVALGADINLAGVDWSVNIGDDCNVTFDGIFDGKDFTISNLTATETAQKADGFICTGLFGAIYGNAVVKNLTIKDVTINAPYAGENVAAVVGFAYNAKGSIENVKVTGVNINAPYATGVGAIVGYDYYSPTLKVENCSVKGNEGSAIVGKSYVGGLVGYASSKIALNKNTVENVSVTGTASVGAIAGIMLAGGSADGSTVKNVTLSATGELWANSVAVVAGTITKGSVTAANTTVENVTVNGAEAPIVGGVLVEKPTTAIAKVQAKIGDVYYTTFDKALAAVQQGETIVLLDDVTVAEGETIVLDGVTVEGATLTNNGTIDLDLNSSIATSVAGNGSIKVDATDITENVTVITGALSNFTGSIIVDGANYDRTNGLEIQTIVVEIVDGQMAEFVNAEEKLVHKFTYTRTLLGRKDSGEFKWSPLYLPVEIPVEGLLENYDVAYINDVHSFDKNDDGEIDEMIIEYIKIKSGVLKANYPYVIRPKNDDSINMELVLTNVELRSSEEKTIQCSSVFETFTIGGTYHKMTGEELEGKLSIKTDGDWKNNDANNSLNPFRLYMTITREGSPVVVDSAKLSIRIAVRGEDDLTEIDNVPLNGSSEDVIFDLHGRRVLTPVKGGVYIINGKKVYFKK